MKVESTKLDGVLILNPHVFNDERGFFYESYSKRKFLENGLDYNFIQDNQSYNKYKHTFRGFHYQMNPKSQTTLVRVVSGEIIDYVIDIRKKSPTYGQYVSQILSSDNHKQMLIPKGFAHGYLTLTDNVTILYKMDELYSPNHDRILNFMDSTINIKLNIDKSELIIADKDNSAPMLAQIDNNFLYEEMI
ncbi:dTDP-4-dehydrorhamnose 3,5-epimerase [Arcobacter nitrofigilis DSM 7299]|uniref:dTDP-4-dehydrorhamnose 3,5-epimerase n=1 Tax=Arcobacter nitrofigilis (strain ATCC 33309 / DSM 7299 / CCUG 15893 / LMG 7604 / NCTC 12251 / CI) TaxID=572480 RepID=D5V6D9_ARCNC|nr:dTDP-4-dehydrorhamnose 3,5-epimerase [Arcobacter nitrofigilis]ADG94209.1 dTDP-4-dehydrorhamnose 3,5-epimerase [Arcobacter nitrofigilis DSM 7299]